jgi:hypothetical protein
MGISAQSRSFEPDRVLLDIVEAVADARDEDVTDLEPIYDFFDPVALQRLLGSASVSTTVELTVYDCRVEVRGDGRVTVIDGPE